MNNGSKKKKGFGKKIILIVLLVDALLVGGYIWFFSSISLSGKKIDNPILQQLVDNMVKVKGGTFMMGATEEQSLRAVDNDERPVFEVTLSDFYVNKYEVTQAEWIAVMGENPSCFHGDNKPVEQVSWNDCQTFIRKLNELTGSKFRLLTEAEWEFAARGGKESQKCQYSGSNDLPEVGWYDCTLDKTPKPYTPTTHEVGSRKPNELGLFDMSGNVSEWCSDWYGSYTSDSKTNCQGVNTGTHRIIRGGSWCNDWRFCRVANRSKFIPQNNCYFIGLRLAF